MRFLPLTCYIGKFRSVIHHHSTVSFSFISSLLFLWLSFHMSSFFVHLFFLFIFMELSSSREAPSCSGIENSHNNLRSREDSYSVRKSSLSFPLLDHTNAVHIIPSFPSQTQFRITKFKSHYDRQSVGQSILVSGTYLGPATNFSLFLWLFLDSWRFVDVGSPLWRENGSVICSAMAKVQFQVTLRPTVCRPVCLGAGPPMGYMTWF
jgi:hypothetical protein